MRTLWMAALLAAGVACHSDPVGNGRTVDPPGTLTSTTLDGAVALTWLDNSFLNDPDIFDRYQVYSTSYDLDNQACGSSLRLEGTTVAPEFVVGALRNGEPVCLGVSAVSIDGIESAVSPLRADTPRPDARNIVLNARQSRDEGSAFRFWQDLNGDGQVQASTELGRVKAGSALDADFSVERDGTGALFLVPVRSATRLAPYSDQPIEDLTSIDVAPPSTSFTRDGLPASPGFGYVFEMAEADGFPRYGAVRLTHVGREFLILDWSFQTDPGNPELRIGVR